ncbi:MAG: hypothetical protein RIC87_21255 [Kiloniellales bacterium]
MLRSLFILSLLSLIVAACGHARIEEQADAGTWSRDMPNLLRQTALQRGITACRNKAPKTAEGEVPCEPVEIRAGDKIYVTTAIKQEREQPDSGFQLNYYRDVWTFCFILVHGQSSTEYLADFRRGVVGPDLQSLGNSAPSTPAKVVITQTDGYRDVQAKNGCDWLWNFTENPQIG